MAIQVYTKTFIDMPTFKITAVEVNGMPWYKGRQVARSIGYANPRQALCHIVDDEDKKTYQELVQGGVYTTPSDLQPRGIYINHWGLWSLLRGSDKEKAKVFELFFI